MDTPAPRRSMRSGRQRFWLRTALVLATLFLLWSAAWFYMPPIVAAQAAKAAEQQLGRRLSLAEVRFNPWTLELTADDLVLAGAREGSPPLLAIKRLRADIAWVSLLRLAPIVDALEIEAPTLRVSRVGDGTYDFDDILRRLAAARPAQPSPDVSRFALHNIVLRGGSAEFEDRPLGVVHRLRDLQVGVPFLSSLPSEREIKVQPHVAFVLDGSRFDSSGSATPFAERGNGELRLTLENLSVVPWLGYLPSGLPARLKSAVLGADLVVAFEQRPRLSLNITGKVRADGIEVVDTASRELLQVGNIRVALDELRPLERRVRISGIDVEAPHLVATRDAAGRINLLLAGEAPSGAATPIARLAVPGAPASAASAASAPAPSRAAPDGWNASVAALSVRAGRLDWRDATTTPTAELAVGDFTLSAKTIAWPLEAPVVFEGAGVVGDGAAQGKLTFAGRAHTASATLDVKLADLPLAPLRPYLRSVLAPALAGAVSADLTAAWTGGDGTPRITVDARRLAAAHLTMGEPKAPDFAAESIELTDARIDTSARKAAIRRVALRAPRVRVERDASRHWSFERWRADGPAVGAGGGAHGSTSAPAAQPGSAAWQLAVDDFAVERARVGLDDRGASMPVAVDLRDLDVQVKGWALDGKARAPFRVTGRVAVPAGPSGKAVGSGVVGSIDGRGELKDFTDGIPSGAQATLLLKDLPLHLLDPYLDDVLNIDVHKAQTSFKGDVRWERRGAGSSVGVRGDATVDDFSATNAATDRAAPQRALAMLSERGGGRQLLNWKSLTLRGIDLALVPGSRPRLRVAETALSDFFARIVLDENGRLNLEDVARPAARPGATSAVAATPDGRAGTRAGAASAPAGGGTAPLPAIVDFGPIAVVNGRVAYNDRFVKPNYNANISELTGRLGAFSSEASASAAGPPLADLTLKGRVEGTASLEITGKVNPLARPLALDLQAKVRDLELPPLSPYAIKYSGYGIERGKMSVDLAYVVQPDGRLTASNKIVLNQLAFGDKVEGSTASLPVKLAVALLADRHGVIDLDLPVSGSINDPQFSLGGVIWKAVTNLLLKAVTAPFSLLASAFGGSSSELSRIEFAAGTATLDGAAKAGLDKVAKALADRPGLALTVTGESRLEVESDAWKRERLQQLVRVEKRRRMQAAGAAANADVVVGEAEYPELLKEVYRRADIVKPKNVLGVAKDVPAGEMEALLLGNMTVGADAMQQLAVRRGVAVRDYLASREIAIERLFLGAPKTAGDESAWSPRADLKLATQ